jgi:hypothetical protein
MSARLRGRVHEAVVQSYTRPGLASGAPWRPRTRLGGLHPEAQRLHGAAPCCRRASQALYKVVASGIGGADPLSTCQGAKRPPSQAAVTRGATSVVGARG